MFRSVPSIYRTDLIQASLLGFVQIDRPKSDVNDAFVLPQNIVPRCQNVSILHLTLFGFHDKFVRQFSCKGFVQLRPRPHGLSSTAGRVMNKLVLMQGIGPCH
jgi:hypothetical protein